LPAIENKVQSLPFDCTADREGLLAVASMDICNRISDDYDFHRAKKNLALEKGFGILLILWIRNGLTLQE
jgi:hypothetical protein